MKAIAYSQDGRPIIGPQDGAQMAMFTSPADIVVGGGAAGGGKTVWLLLEAARHVHVKDYTAIVFRRQYNDIVGPGGLWDTSEEIYKALSGTPNRGRASWSFPAGAEIKFGHLNKESDKYRHQGLAYTGLLFDEFSHYSKSQLFYLLTRNRNFGECSIRPFCRMAGNPDADHFIADFVSWWWNPETGYPIDERAGKIRYFVRNADSDEVEWVSPDYRDEYGNAPKSVTFIPSKLDDNKMMPNIAEYRASIMEEDKVNRERLVFGNWLISYSGGMFDPTWFEIVDEVPEEIREKRYWDLAATEEDEEKAKDPDYTAGAKGDIVDGDFYVTDVKSFRKTPGSAVLEMKRTAKNDGKNVDVWWEEEKGGSGKYTSEYMMQVFEGYNASPDPVEHIKTERAAKWAAWAEFGRVKFLRGAWNKLVLARAGKFPFGKKDEIDAISGLFKVCVMPRPIIRYYNRVKHFIEYKKTLVQFDKIQPQNASAYIILWIEEDGGIYGGCYLWLHQKKKLKMYNEIFEPHPIPRVLAEEIKERAVVPIKDEPNRISIKQIFCNSIMGPKGKSNVIKELRKYGIRARVGGRYDERSSFLRTNKRFAENTISIHSDCVETDVQLRRFAYKDKKAPKGFPLVRSLCMIEGYLNEVTRAEVDMEPKPYSRKKLAIRDKLRRGDTPSKRKVNQYEYLT